MPITYIIILIFIGLILNIWIMMLSLRIFRVKYTWKQFCILIVALITYSALMASALYLLRIKVEDISLYLLLPIVCLELWLIYGMFRFLRISITWLKYLGIMSIQCIYGIILVSISLFFSVFVFHGASMMPSYYDGDTLFVNKLSYITTSPKYNDIVVIQPGVDRIRDYYIKRVIATPGDTIRFMSGSVFLKKAWSSDFQKLDEPFLTQANRDHTDMPEYIEENEFLLPPDSYWVMGDNRRNSADSRQCFQYCIWKSIEAHYISREKIIGKVIMKF